MKLSARDWRHYAAATTIFLLAFPVFAHLSPSLADGMPSEIRELIKEEGIANEQCRGGSGDNPETQQACDKRDQIVSKLKKMGWCYGTDDQPMYQRQWQPCAPATKLNDAETLRKAQQQVGEATKDPQAVKLMECAGVKVYQDPQPPGHPPTAEECNRLLQDTDNKRANSAVSTPASGENSKNPPADGNIPQASDPAGAKFAADVTVAAKVLRTGRAAIYCGIRSQRWYRPLEAGLTMVIDDSERKLRGQATSIAAFNTDAERVRKWAGLFIVGTIPSRDESMRLIDSPELARADELQRRATGGYR